MKGLILGLGSIGTRHAKNLMALGIEVLGLEPNRDMRQLEIEYVNSIKDAEADFAVICSPTDMHMPQALECAGKGMHLFIEKPPSDTLAFFEDLKKIVKKYKIIVMIACNFRFSDGLQLIKELVHEKKYGELLSMRSYFGQYLPAMRKGRDYRTLYAAGESGGVVLDSFHEFDYVNWFLGQPVKIKSFCVKISNLEIKNEDIAEVILKYKNAVAEIHIDYLRKKYKRSCEFIFEKATIIWDYKADELRETVELYDGTDKKNLLDNVLDVNKMYVEEMKHFVDCLKNRKVPMLGIEEAEKILEVMLKVREK